jgi:hypothetical protein
MIQQTYPETSLPAPFRKVELGGTVWITQSMFSQGEGVSEGCSQLAMNIKTGNSQLMRCIWKGSYRVS